MDSVIRAAVVYAFILLLFRLTGKRTLAQVTPFDLVLTLIVSEAIQQALVDIDNSLTNAFLVVTTLVALDACMLWGTHRWARLDRVVNGLPTVIVEDGKLLRYRMGKEWVSPHDVLSAARKQGLHGIEQVKYAIIERNGEISIVPKNDEGA